MREILSFEILAGHQILLEFDNFEKRIYDMSDKLSGVFAELADYEKFKAVKIVYGALTWFRENDHEIDICPDAIYFDSVPF